MIIKNENVTYIGPHSTYAITAYKPLGFSHLVLVIYANLLSPNIPLYIYANIDVLSLCLEIELSKIKLPRI